MRPFAILMSGLPASGKTTIGRALAEEMALPCLDKDHFLEALFEEKGVGDQAWRRRLSIEADAKFQSEALVHDRAVLISHWRPKGLSATGTPTDWVTEQVSHIVEIFCDCSPEAAADRFMVRRRHAGHLDHERSHTEVRAWMQKLAPLYPLQIGTTFQISTEDSVSLPQLVTEISHILT